ncbi:MAG: hypothetical protein WC916_04230 [Candidatus Woesearchaeota archaeon]
MTRNLEERTDIKEIVHEAGMSTRPEFYSGRGAITGDLNYSILEKIYQGVEKIRGKEDAKQFVNMVADIPKLSATDFLLTLYKLDAMDWKWDKKLLGNERGVFIDGSTDEAKFATGLFTMAEIMCGSNARDETDYIRERFLQAHGKQTPTTRHYAF